MGASTVIREFDLTGVVDEGCQKIIVTNVEQLTQVVEEPPTEVVQIAEQGPPGAQGVPGPVGPSALYWVDFLIDAGIVAAKQVTLPAAPVDPLKVEVVIYTGIQQKSGVDFLVTGDVLSWDSLALELLIEEGQTLTVRYL